MNPLSFIYPLGAAMDEDTHIEEGTIYVLQGEYPPYEITVAFRGLSYLMILGRYCNGGFLCIPRIGLGADLGDHRDLCWNEESLKRTGIAPDLAEMFAQAVYEAYEYCLVW